MVGKRVVARLCSAAAGQAAQRALWRAVWGVAWRAALARGGAAGRDVWHRVESHLLNWSPAHRVIFNRHSQLALQGCVCV